MRKFIVFVIASVFFMFFVACQTEKELTSGTATAEKRVEEPKPFDYATLPDKAEWTVKLDKPLEVVRQEIQSTNMPESVWIAFPLPEFQDGGRFRPMVRPGVQRSFGYGMDSAGCTSEALVKTNSISCVGGGAGIAGGQYAYCQRVKIDDVMLYDPRQYSFFIAYAGAYLEITFPNLQTMHVRRLEAPDLSKVKHCGPGDDWRCRFENCD